MKKNLMIILGIIAVISILLISVYLLFVYPSKDIYIEGKVTMVRYMDDGTTIVIVERNQFSEAYHCKGYITNLKEGKTYDMHFQRPALGVYRLVDAYEIRYYDN